MSGEWHIRTDREKWERLAKFHKGHPELGGSDDHNAILYAARRLERAEEVVRAAKKYRRTHVHQDGLVVDAALARFESDESPQNS